MKNLYFIYALLGISFTVYSAKLRFPDGCSTHMASFRRKPVEKPKREPLTPVDRDVYVNPTALESYTRELMALFAEGSETALEILQKIKKFIKSSDVKGNSLLADLQTFLRIFYHLDKMNIRGTQIRIAYRSYAGITIRVLVNGILDMDYELPCVVNRRAREYWGLSERAVADEYADPHMDIVASEREKGVQAASSDDRLKNTPYQGKIPSYPRP